MRERAPTKEEAKGDGMGRAATRLDPCVRCGARFCHAQYVSAAPGLCPGCSGIHREMRAQKQRSEEAKKRTITSLLEEIEALDKFCVNSADLRSAHKICKKCSAIFQYFMERVTVTDHEAKKDYTRWQRRVSTPQLNDDHCYACNSLAQLLIQFQQRRDTTKRATAERQAERPTAALDDDIPF